MCVAVLIATAYSDAGWSFDAHTPIIRVTPEQVQRLSLASFTSVMVSLGTSHYARAQSMDPLPVVVLLQCIHHALSTE